MSVPSLTVRRRMVSVAIVGVLIGIKLGCDRRRDRFWRAWAANALEMEPTIDKVKESLAQHPGSTSEWAVESRKLVMRSEYYGRLAKKYRWEAEHPWLPVEPGPPVLE